MPVITEFIELHNTDRDLQLFCKITCKVCAFLWHNKIENSYSIYVHYCNRLIAYHNWGHLESQETAINHAKAYLRCTLIDMASDLQLAQECIV